jgi:hypothetical protein
MSRIASATRLHRAKTAASRADVAEDHDRRRLARPAFAEIGALRALAHGVEFVLVDDFRRLLINRAARNFRAKPRRLPRVERKRSRSLGSPGDPGGIGRKGLVDDVFHE